MTELNRAFLYQETHARPYLNLPVPCTVAHLSYWKGDSQSTELLDLAKTLAQRQGITPKSHQNSFFEYACQNYHIRFEQHTEFDTLTIAQSLELDAPVFGTNPLSIVDEAALANIDAQILVKTHLHIALKPEDTSDIKAEVTRQFADINGETQVYGSYVMDRRAEVYTDFKLDAQGNSRYFAVSHSLNNTDAGRLITRLIEMEHYRILALIPMKDVRTVSKELTGIDTHLAQILSAISDNADESDPQAQHRRLDELLEIAKVVESHRNTLSSRFSASRAYYQIVQFSYDKLHEEKLGSLQRLQTFVERRLGPAVRTFDSMRRRLEDISHRIDRIAELLRTEINVQMQFQNSAMLKGMDNSAKMQLKMQKTVEGISIVALTYYAISVLGYLIGIFVHGDTKYTVMGLLVLPVAGLIWQAQKKLLHKTKPTKTEDKDTIP